MAALTFDTARVGLSQDARYQIVEAAFPIEQGMAVYKNSLNTYDRAAADDSDLYAVAGVAMTPCDTGEYFLMVAEGDIIFLDNVLTQGETYVLSHAPGAIKPVGDLQYEEYVVQIGTATSTRTLSVKIVNSGAQVPLP